VCVWLVVGVFGLCCVVWLYVLCGVCLWCEMCVCVWCDVWCVRVCVSVFVCVVCVCGCGVFVCVTLSVISCNNNPLHLQRVGRGVQNKKQTIRA